MPTLGNPTGTIEILKKYQFNFQKRYGQNFLIDSHILESTARQLYLYRLLGLPAPQFAHCPLLLAPDGRRLSKRDGDQSLENLRAKYTAQEIVGKLAYAYGLQPEPAPCTPESLIPAFSWAKVPKQDVCLPEGLF